jgi:hypothetical protein
MRVPHNFQADYRSILAVLLFNFTHKLSHLIQTCCINWPLISAHKENNISHKKEYKKQCVKAICMQNLPTFGA